MDDLISRQAALKAIKFAELGCEYEAVEAVPSADVQPVRHGKWIPKFNGQFKGGAYWFDCSVCGRIVPDVRNGGWNYCPNCGARMDGERK